MEIYWHDYANRQGNAPITEAPVSWLLLRFVASFCGVFGFSVLFNSSVPMAVSAAVIGAIVNTMRLELVDYTEIPRLLSWYPDFTSTGASIIWKRWKREMPRSGWSPRCGSSSRCLWG